jgi:SAM-dependent methyltransferase
MRPLLYSDLVPWYRLLDPFEDHLDEATCYGEALASAAVPRAETVLELGAGAGGNAFHLKQRFRCTLTDLSEEMLGLSRELNPECEHLLGDMRTLRLGRTFDGVLVHDAVMYMTSEEDLLAMARTAFLHTRPGGAAVFAPDYVRETYHEDSQLHAGGDGRCALRCLEWTWDPNPSDTTFVTEYAFLLRDGDDMQAVHDRHTEGLFPRATWFQVLGSVGYRVETIPRPLDDGGADEIFLCRRPA